MSSITRELTRPFRHLLTSPVIQRFKYVHYRFTRRHASRRSPNFFIVGAPHSGSTSLYAYVGQHPQVYMSARKEPNFFRSGRWGVGWVSRYLDLFDGAEPEHRVTGEASPWYLYDRNAAQRIQGCVPESSIAIILRDPVERAVSQFQYFLLRQGPWPRDPVERFRAHVTAERRLAHTVSGGRGHELRAGLYRAQVERYLRAFPRDQVYICLSDELRRSPEQVMRQLFEFLEVDPSFVPDMTADHHRTPQPHRITLPGDLDRELRDYFASDVTALSELLGRDLSHWLNRSP